PLVTGVQTCALPIFPAAAPAKEVKPGAKAVPAAPTKAAQPADDTRLSGPHWAGVKEYLGSKSMDTLVDPFKGNITSFIAMLRARSEERRVGTAGRAR